MVGWGGLRHAVLHLVVGTLGDSNTKQFHFGLERQLWLLLPRRQACACSLRSSVHSDLGFSVNDNQYHTAVVNYDLTVRVTVDGVAVPASTARFRRRVGEPHQHALVPWPRAGMNGQGSEHANYGWPDVRNFVISSYTDSPAVPPVVGQVDYPVPIGTHAGCTRITKRHSSCLLFQYMPTVTTAASSPTATTTPP